MSNLSFTSKICFTGILLMHPYYRGQEVPCNMLSYLFSCCEAIPTLPVPLFRLLPDYSCVQSVHIPKSPAKNTASQLWTLITFFWLGSFAPYFTKSLKYISISFSEKLLLFCALSKKLKNWPTGITLGMFRSWVACNAPLSFILATLAPFKSLIILISILVTSCVALSLCIIGTVLELAVTTIITISIVLYYIYINSNNNDMSGTSMSS